MVRELAKTEGNRGEEGHDYEGLIALLVSVVRKEGGVEGSEGERAWGDL